MDFVKSATRPILTVCCFLLTSLGPPSTSILSAPSGMLESPVLFHSALRRQEKAESSGLEALSRAMRGGTDFKPLKAIGTDQAAKGAPPPIDHRTAPPSANSGRILPAVSAPSASGLEEPGLHSADEELSGPFRRYREALASYHEALVERDNAATGTGLPKTYFTLSMGHHSKIARLERESKEARERLVRAALLAAGSNPAAALERIRALWSKAGDISFEQLSRDGATSKWTTRKVGFSDEEEAFRQVLNGTDLKADADLKEAQAQGAGAPSEEWSRQRVLARAEQVARVAHEIGNTIGRIELILREVEKAAGDDQDTLQEIRIFRRLYEQTLTALRRWQDFTDPRDIDQGLETLGPQEVGARFEKRETAFARMLYFLNQRVPLLEQAIRERVRPLSDVDPPNPPPFELARAFAYANMLVQRLYGDFVASGGQFDPSGRQERVDLALFSQEIGPFLRILVEGQMRIDVEVEPRTPDILIDPVRLAEVLENPVLNAVRAASDSDRLGAPLTIHFAPAGDGKSVLLEISDQAGGMSAEALERVASSRVFTTKEGQAARGHGLGIGAIARPIIEAAGGRLELVSRLGEGTVYRILFPAAQPLPERLLQQRDALAEMLAAFQRERNLEEVYLDRGPDEVTWFLRLSGLPQNAQWLRDVIDFAHQRWAPFREERRLMIHLAPPHPPRGKLIYSRRDSGRQEKEVLGRVLKRALLVAADSGLEELQPGRLLRPEVRAQIVTRGWAELGESRFLVSEAILADPPGRIFLHSGLEEPAGLPASGRVVPMAARSVPELLLFFREREVGGGDLIVANLGIVTRRELAAAMPLVSPPPGFLGLPPRLRLHAHELLMLGLLSRRVGPLFLLDVRRVTAETGETLLLIQA